MEWGAILSAATTAGVPFVLVVLTVIAKHLLDIAKKLEEGQKELQEDNQALLRSRIKERGDMVIERGKISYEEAEDLSHLYDRYVKEGGNSFIEELMERVKALPIFKDK